MEIVMFRRERLPVILSRKTANAFALCAILQHLKRGIHIGPLSEDEIKLIRRYKLMSVEEVVSSFDYLLENDREQCH
jgi:hypothetical protein